MLAALGELPGDPEAWAFEFKWDGVRTLAACDAGQLRLISRRQRDVTATFPDLGGLAAAVGCPALLDGEVVALDAHGRPSFTRLQQRLGVTDPRAAEARAATVPVAYLAFDLLHLRGRSTRDLAYERRRELLEGFGLSGERWQIPPSVVGAGADVLVAAERLGLEGVVGKRLGSRYEPGRRSRSWRKTKLLVREEFLVGGWLAGEGLRAGRIGALLLGQWDVTPDQAAAQRRPQRLEYAGSVGTGFSEDELATLAELLAPLARPDSPFDVGLPRAGGTWVEPRLVVAVAYQERTPAGIIRHPRYEGRREGRDLAAVVRQDGRDRT